MTSIGTDLPAPVAAALSTAVPDPGTRTATLAAGLDWSSIAWGEAGDPPLLLVHGVTASARIWWRVGPALAAGGRRVIAVDLPGHGRTSGWLGHHRFRDNAVNLAAWIQAAGMATAPLQVVGHSYGAMTAAALPLAGFRPARLVLLDPPAVPLARISLMASDPSEQPSSDLAELLETLGANNPDWPAGDVEAKAEALTELNHDAARAILLENGDWDGGLEALSDPAAAGVPTWIVRGDPAAGSLVPDAALAGLGAIVGGNHVITLAGAPHAPQRTHAADLVAALLTALG